MHKPKTVFFCGAGASVAAGYPTMLGFSHAVRACTRLSEAERADFDRIQVACSAFTSMTGGSSRNLEDIASLLSVLALSQPTLEFSGCSKKTLPSDALSLVEKCVKVVFDPSTSNGNGCLQALVQFAAERSEGTFVTTNYDLNIELSAATVGVHIDTSNSIQAACSTTKIGTSEACHSIYRHNAGYRQPHQPPLSNIQLYKLHGSVNWYQDGQRLSVEDRYLRTFVFDGSGDRRPHWSLEASEATSSRDVCSRHLVLPAVIKANGLHPMQEEWTGAARAMSQAEQIWFIGYSFPQTDAFMRYFLAGALQGNTGLRQIVIVDPNVVEIVGAIGELFGSPELAPLIKPVPMKLEDITSIMDALLERRWYPSTDDRMIQQLRGRLEGQAVVQGAISFMGGTEQPGSYSRVYRLNRMRRH